MKTQCSQKIIMVHSPESCWEDCNYLLSPLLAPSSCHLWGRIRIAKVPQIGQQVVPPNRDWFFVVQSLSRVQLVTPWTAGCQASLSFTLSRVCPLSRWCYLTISSSASPLSFFVTPNRNSWVFILNLWLSRGKQWSGRWKWGWLFIPKTVYNSDVQNQEITEVNFREMLCSMYRSCKIWLYVMIYLGFPGDSAVKNPPANAGGMGLILGSRSLGKGMATHSSILAWRIPGTEKPGRLQSMGSQKSRTWLSD